LQEIYWGTRKLLERVAEDLPLLVVFDDVHWADALVLETIEQLVAQGSDAVHVVCLAREELLEERPSFLAGAERIALAPLSDDDARMLVVELGAATPRSPSGRRGIRSSSSSSSPMRTRAATG
jgi:predicted ATPase